MALHLKVVFGIALLCNAESLITISSTVRHLQFSNEDRFNFFDVELLEAVCKKEGGNIIISPASIKATLGMVLEGVRSKSEEEIRAALRLHNPRHDTRLLFHKYLTSLQEHGVGYSVEMANRIFVSNNVTIQPEFANNLKKFYISDIQNVEFEQSGITANIINDWIKSITHGLIPKLVDPDDLSGNAHLLLANALYFKGTWKTSFSGNDTKQKCFYKNKVQCVNAYMMESLDYYRYGNIEALDAQAIELPYQDNRFSMLIVLPNKRDGIWQLIRDIPHSPLMSILSALQVTETVVNLPRFQMEYSTDLVSVLQSLQIKSIFGPGADLSGMVKDSNGLFISNIFHKAKIEVNEEGSIAGAGTGALVIPLMGSNIVKFNADHPFLFFIRNTVTGSFIFAGRVTEPEEVKSVHMPSADNVFQESTASNSINKQTVQPKPLPTPMNSGSKPFPSTKPFTVLGSQPTSPQTSQIHVTGRAPFSNFNSQILPTTGSMNGAGFPTNAASYYNYSMDGSDMELVNDTKPQYQQPQPSDKDGIHFYGQA